MAMTTTATRMKIARAGKRKLAEGDRAKNVVAHVPPEELYTREWPSVHRLNSRVRKLIAGYVRTKKQEQKKLIAEQETGRVWKLKEEQRLTRLAEQRENREQKQYLLSITWTKKEK